MLLSTPAGRYFAFFSAYFYQGLVAGFSLTALTNHYAEAGLGAAEVGRHYAVSGLPWTVQPLLWGPVVDRFTTGRMGRRRFWIVLAILGAHGALASLLLVRDPLAAVGLVSAVFLAHSLFASLLDTALDGAIIDRVPPAELGRTSACTRGGFVTGAAFSAAVFSWTLGAYGFGPTVALLLGLSVLATLPPLLIRERREYAWLSLRLDAAPEPGRPDAPTFGHFARSLLAALKRPEALALLGLCFTVEFAVNGFQVRFQVDMVQGSGWDAAALSRLQAGLAFASGTVGALVVGLWSDRVGATGAVRALLTFCAAAFLLVAALLAAGLAGPAGPVILGLGTIVPALMYVALVPVVARASGQAIAATQFALFMAAMNGGDVAGAAASGVVEGVLSLPATALAVALVFAAWALALTRRPDLLAPGDGAATRPAAWA
jgi:PAT family beta-lactamase induction signal transducer AmpG